MSPHVLPRFTAVALLLVCGSTHAAAPTVPNAGSGTVQYAFTPGARADAMIIAAIASARQQVLGRRRMTLLALGLAVPITLGAALFTGSTILLFVNLVFDVILAGFIAMLLQIKQAQQVSRPKWTLDPEEEVRVVP